MKKILIFSLSYIPHVGGAEVAIRAITNRIPNIEWHMITLRFGNEKKDEEIEKIKIHRVGLGSSYFSKSLFIFFATVKAIKLNRRHKFDGFWAMMSYMVLPIVFLRILGIKIPYVITLQEGDTYDYMFKRPHIIPFLPFISLGFQKATVVQAISNYLGEWAKRLGYRGKVEIIPNGCDIWWFSKKDHLTQNRKVFWRNRDIDDSNFIMITTSRLVWKNALDDVIQSLPKLLEDMHFVILGKGPEKTTLEKLTESLGLSNRVHFLGEVSNSETANYLSMSDIFIRPSRSEGMGISFIEAMAAGLPVVATQEGGIADFLFDAKRNPDKKTTGWAVDKNSPEQIVKAVKEILSNKEKVFRVTANAQKMVTEKYDWNIIARDMEEKVFDRLFNT